MMSERSWKRRCGAWASAWCWRCRSASANPISSPTNSSGARAATPRSTSPSSRRSACASPRDRAHSRRRSSSRWRHASSATTRNSTTCRRCDAMRCRRTCASSNSSSSPGALLNSAHAQSHYLSANYTHVARELLARGVNVIAHVVAKRMVGGATEISLGSNPDVTVDLHSRSSRSCAPRASRW